MLYTAAFNEDFSYSNMDSYFDAIKLLVTGDISNFLKHPMASSRYSFPPNNEYPKDKRYVFVGKVVDLAPKALTDPGDISLWFKKEHPLYAGHFLYVGLRFVRNYFYNSQLTPWILSVDIAESYVSGMLINRQKGWNPADIYGNPKPNMVSYNYQWSDSNSTSMYGQIFYSTSPMLKAVKADYGTVQASANITFLLSDWGFGFFGAASRRATYNSVSNFMGALFLETLATKLDSTNDQAFIPANYPMVALMTASDLNPNYNTGGSNWAFYTGTSSPSLNSDKRNIANNALNRKITLIRAPGQDVTLSDAPDKITSSLAYNITGGAVPDKAHVYRNADGEQCAEMYPVFLRNQNTLLAKLPLMKPVVGSYRYVHINKRLEVDSKVYHGITTTSRCIGHFNPELSCDQYVDLRLDGLNSEYIRLK